MPKYLYAENVTEQERNSLQSFKRRGAREFIRGRIIELSVSGTHPAEIAKRHGKVRLLVLCLPTQAPWLNPLEAVIGMIVRYGLQNKTHKSEQEVCDSIDNYIDWRNSGAQTKAA